MAGMQFGGFGMCPRYNRVKRSTYKILGLREAKGRREDSGRWRECRKGEGERRRICPGGG